MKNLALGVDLGGTKLKVAVVDRRQGKIVCQENVETNAHSGPRAVIENVTAHLQAILDCYRQDLDKTIGVGVAGDIDQKRGVVRISPNLKGWKNIPLAHLLSKALKVSVMVDNDANTAAWAAFHLDAGARVNNLLAVTLGTGIGGGLILNRRLYWGGTGTAGEIGHLTVEPQGIPCACGNRGCLERYIGVKAMNQMAREALESGRRTVLRGWVKKNYSLIDPLLLEKAARAGDALAKEIWKTSSTYLGVALAGFINIFNPDMIVLCGGISRARDLLMKPLLNTIRRRAFETPWRHVKILCSQRDQDLGVVGAALLTLRKR